MAEAANAVQLSLYRGSSANLDNLQKVDGALIYTPDDNKMFIDSTINGSVVRKQVNKDKIFNGTYEEYEAALANGEIEDGTLVNITDDSDDSSAVNYATSGMAGIVKPDNTTITVSSGGVISAGRMFWTDM